MGLRWWKFVLALFVLGGVAAADIPSTPGYHEKRDLPGGGGTYDLYLPKSYGQRKDSRHPVIIVLRPHDVVSLVEWIDKIKLGGWAEGSDAILLGVNRFWVGPGPARQYLRPGEPQPPGLEAMIPYMALVEKIPQAHPSVRIVMGVSHNAVEAQRVWALGTEFSRRISGIVVGPVVYVPGDREAARLPVKPVVVYHLRVTHESYARSHETEPYVLRRGPDPWGYELWDRKIASLLRQNGNHLFYSELPGWHLIEPNELAARGVHEALWWVLDATWLQHPGVSAAERSGAMADLKNRFGNAQTEENAIRREWKLRSLLALPGVLQSSGPTAVGREFIPAWRQAVLPAALARENLYFRYLFLRAVNEESLLKGSPEAKEIAVKLTEVTADKVFKTECTALETIRRITLASWPHPEDRDLARIAMRRQMFDALAQKWPETLGGKEAAGWRRLMERYAADVEEEAKRKSQPREAIRR